ncbi:ogr/Delta-like zinc finger family protein [Enterobacter hormaechei]|uniref:ogr/Delta-like zinc finger family protein n=2 Tax=Enterobacter TaxID=547 RepID=UPI0012517637|nr:ogr/Delta-like zinc finger family protein [Enterobacter hormaechei]HED1599512.1 ogr/Delta-like zinc finger family protein [Enterobacter hormaechei subsp. hoffmannii]MBA7810302.1 ogr/Delta-like zinc finger family protein [Enterobacter hormaechei]MBA7908806.1 ogr/Delta-like zinc finger family protein [Enterobacter hormaechei]MBE0231061.1 ogr/Delta-like zinc finger family protein [Enterobacter hormaechei]QLP13990.1 ogr/Delta-like zinc finger family protein [Enterobacter hormaechei]
MAMRCPRCRAVAKTRTSVELSDLVRRSYHQCQNMLCGYCFTSMTQIDESLNQTQPVPGAVVPQDVFPRSHHGENQLQLTL